MNFITFERELKNFPAFSLRDTEKLSSKVYYHRLAEWQDKDYIKRIANGVFVFTNGSIDEMQLFYLANRIYEPSYISLESALAFYGFIPESVYAVTSVSTKKTSAFHHDAVAFTYRTINRKLNFGYILLQWKNVAIKIAEPEKAVLDFFYLHPELSTVEQIEGMRFNVFSMKEKMDWGKINAYLSLYNNKRLYKRIQTLGEWLNHA